MHLELFREFRVEFLLRVAAFVEITLADMLRGAGYRGIYDLANMDASLYIITTGQSGNLFSPHYDDLLELWANGGYVTIPTDRATIDREAATTLTLTP